MSLSAIIMLIVSLAIVPGGLAASAIYLIRKPEVAQYPALPPGLAD